jgi:hypothetical protein
VCCILDALRGVPSTIIIHPVEDAILVSAVQWSEGLRAVGHSRQITQYPRLQGGAADALALPQSYSAPLAARCVALDVRMPKRLIESLNLEGGIAPTQSFGGSRDHQQHEELNGRQRPHSGPLRRETFFQVSIFAQSTTVVRPKPSPAAAVSKKPLVSSCR